MRVRTPGNFLKIAEMLQALKGHGFSRAAEVPNKNAALAAEGMQVAQNEPPQGLRPSISFAVLMARLKSCPFKPPGLRSPERISAVCMALVSLLFAGLATAPLLNAQAPIEPQSATPQGGPIAIVTLDNKNPETAASVTGALQVSAGKAIIGASGTVTSGSRTTDVILPHRGVLRVCASTTVKLAADSSVPAGETPGLMMAFDHGAVEASFATGRNSDILLTPEFRILIGGPGAAEVKVRLGQHGDTCVDNAGVNAPYVLVTSVFEGGDYRVQAGQRVMFQHGSVREVVDDEKEPCGCPPPTNPGTNEFPLAESAGLAPLPKPAPGVPMNSSAPPQIVEPLVYKSGAQPVAEAQPGVAVSDGKKVKPPAGKQAANSKPGFFHRVGHFFRRMFGAE